jgi:hypothetical protein
MSIQLSSSEHPTQVIPADGWWVIYAYGEGAPIGASRVIGFQIIRGDDTDRDGTPYTYTRAIPIVASGGEVEAAHEACENAIQLIHESEMDEHLLRAVRGGVGVDAMLSRRTQYLEEQARYRAKVKEKEN